MYIKHQSEQSPDSTIYKFLALVIIFIVVGIIAFLLLSSKSDAEKPVIMTETATTQITTIPINNESETSKSETESPPKPSETILSETEDAGQEYIDKITFLGDSTTYGLRHYKMLKDGKNTLQVWTPLSGTLTLSQADITKIYYPDNDTEITIIEAVKLKKPEIMIITLGVNGVSFMDEDFFKSSYTKLVEGIKSASPDTVIILQSIFPVAQSYTHLEQINNEKIKTANEWILNIAAENEVNYLDTASALADENGNLPEKDQNGDGIHLNETGFAIQLDYVRTHAYTYEE